MKLLALMGNPRKHGHTAKMADLFLKGAASAGASIQVEDLTTLDVRACLGCYGCWTKTPGRCVQRDDMARLLDAFMKADLVFVATPIYAFAVSSYVKHFMERTLTILSPGAEIGENGLERNRWRYPGQGPKRMAALVLAGRKTPDIVQPTLGMLEFWAVEMRMRCSGILVRFESSALRFPQAKPLRVKSVMTSTERAGIEFVTKPVISPTLLENVSAPLLADVPHFVEYSRVFWEHALAIGDECDAAGESAGQDVRILIREMARNANPAALQGINATVQFDFPDKGLTFTLLLQDGRCTIDTSTKAVPDLLIRCPAALWSDVVQRRIAGSQLLNHPELHLKGDLKLFRRFPHFFPPPAD